VNAVCFEDSGKYFISASSDKSLILWNINDMEPVQRLQGHGWEVYDLEISHDLKYIASCGADRPVFLWDAGTCRIVRKYHGHTHRINCVTFSEDASVLASASYDRTVRVWDMRAASSRLPIQILEHATDSVESVSMCGTWIQTASVDGSLRTYDVRNGGVLVDDFKAPITSTSMNKDASCSLISLLDSSLHLVDLESGGSLISFKGHVNTRYRLCSTFSRSEASVISGSEDGVIYIWDVLSGNVTARLAEHKQAVNCVEWHPNKDAFLSASMDCTLRLWES
jgi:mitogen-activated protein kinase organizer 1